MKITIRHIIETTGLKVINSCGHYNDEISGFYASDLLSDVMGRAKEKNIWITLHTHKNIVAVAALKNLPAIIIVNGNQPDADTIQAADNENIMLISAHTDTFTLCGKIFKLMKAYAMV